MIGKTIGFSLLALLWLAPVARPALAAPALCDGLAHRIELDGATPQKEGTLLNRLAAMGDGFVSWNVEATGLRAEDLRERYRLPESFTQPLVSDSWLPNATVYRLAPDRIAVAIK